MTSVRITMKDGTINDHKHRGRAGGSYTKSVRYEGAFVVVVDEYRAETAYPASDVAKVEKYDVERYY